MYYATADLKARLGQDRFLKLFDRDRDGTEDSDVLSAVHAYSKALIEAMLAHSHTSLIPFDGASGNVTPPQFITDLAIDIAIGRVAEAYPGAIVTPAGVPSPYSGLKATAIKMLERLAKDEGPRLATGAGAPVSAGAGNVSAPTPVFSAAAVSHEADPNGESVNGTGGRYSGF
jgi:hypothetical protein